MGEKHLCSFCGLNGESLRYRSKSAGKVLEEIRYFHSRWKVEHGLQAVDNILPLQYFSDLVPTLAEEQKKHPVGIFFEIKSNLKRSQMFQLAAAGFTTLQPGIESFSDHILALMDKGATAFQQICCVKWGQEVGISITYNILLRNPGETLEDYEEMLDQIPFIRHLLPPNGVANMQLERYSPYFMRPEKFGIHNIRPKAHYAEMFPDERVNLTTLVYQFDFDHDELDLPDLSAIPFDQVSVFRDAFPTLAPALRRLNWMSLHIEVARIFEWLHEVRRFRSLKRDLEREANGDPRAQRRLLLTIKDFWELKAGRRMTLPKGEADHWTILRIGLRLGVGHVDAEGACGMLR